MTALSRIVDIYCRVSTDPQEDNTSLDEQEACGRQFCREHGFIVGEVHREVFSGYVYRERDKLDVLRQRYREGKIQGVVIRTLDRLSRSQVHNAILMEEMEHHAVILYCVKENIDDTPMGKFIRMVLAFVAEMEREKIMDRMTSGRVNKASQGKIVSGSKAPYGWQWRYLDDKREEKEVVLYEEQAVVLQWIAEQYADGASAHGLTNQLNDETIPEAGTPAHPLMQQLQAMESAWPPPAPNGEKWNSTSLRRLIGDPRITGKGAKLFAYQNRKTKRPLEPIDLPDGTYPAIISEDLFARVRARMEINKGDAIRAGKQPEEYLLRAGFVRCGYCNKAMMGVQHRKNFTYRCTHAEMGHTNVILSKQLDEQIWEWLQQLANHITLIEQAVALATSSDKIQQDTQAIEQSIQTWRAKVNNYLSDLDDSNLIGDSRTAIRDAMNKANKMILQLEEERLQVTAGMIDKEREKEAYQDILSWCKHVKESREELSYQRKRDFLRMLGVVVLITNKKPFYENMVYTVEITLPAVRELIVPATRVTCETSSEEDIVVTKQLVDAAHLLDIELLDHIVIGNPRYISLKEHMRW